MVSADGTSVAEPESAKPSAGSRSRRSSAKPKKPVQRKIDKDVIEFQPDAVEIEERPIPGGARWTLYVVILMIIASVAWAWFTKVDRLVETMGKLVTTVEPIVIQPLQSAVVREVMVKFGDRVRPGDTLAMLDGTFSEAEVAKLRDGIAANQAAVTRLDAERNGTDFVLAEGETDRYLIEQHHLFMSRRIEHQAKVAEIEAEIEKANAEAETNRVLLASSEAKIKLLTRLAEKSRELFERGSESEVQMLNNELKLLEEETVRDNLNAKIREYEGSITRETERLGALRATWLAEVDEQTVTARQNMGQLQEDLAKAIRLEELVELIVPTHLPDQEYVVFEIAERSAGSVAQEDQPLIKLIPLDVPLELEVEVQAKDIGYIQINDPTRVKIEAFSYQKHGVINGTLRTISEGSFTENRGETPVTFFRARVALPPNARLEGVPADALMPGMAASGEIKVGERRVLEYVLYPLIRQLDRSVREP